MTPERWRQITGVFQNALAHDAATRGSYLDRACAGDDALRGEVEALLSADNEAGDFGTALVPPTPFAAGDLIADRFRIVRFIAGGGMGQVYEAEDTDLRVRVAIKAIRPELARDDRAIRHFKREVRAARRVTHPNVCRTFDVVYDRRPTADVPGPANGIFITMELLEGETLADLLGREGRLSLKQALPIIEQIAGGLAAAHQAGVVHRDLKGSNVMLVPAKAGGGHPRVVITDFGLARVAHAPGESPSSSTLTGKWGTPAYMAPEQLEGNATTPASDIYALGVITFEMVTGVYPFEGESPLAAALKRLGAPAPSARSCLRGLDPRWDATIQRCLERRPEARFQNVVDIPLSLAGRE